MNEELKFNAVVRRLSTQEKTPAGQGEGKEASPAKNRALSPHRTSSWRDWLDLQIDRGWLTDGGEYTTDWTVSA